jgi:hypothetical protein
VNWEGVDQGHGRLLERRLTLEVSGKSLPQQIISQQIISPQTISQQTTKWQAIGA